MNKIVRSRRVMAEAHRGYSAKYPENTLSSFKAAMELGVDQVEFDIWLSKDGVPVIMHDENAKRTTGVDRLITEMTLEEIKELDAGKLFSEEFAGEKVPTLFEILTLFSQNPKLCFGVEIKGDNKKSADVAVKMLNEFKMIERCWFYAWDATIVKYLKQTHGVRTMGYPDFIMMNLDCAPDYYEYCDEIGLPGDFLSSALCNKIFSDGKTIRAFCMDTEEDVIDAIDCGVNAITSNNPVPLINYLNKHDMRYDREYSYIKQSDEIAVVADCREIINVDELKDAESKGADKVLISADGKKFDEFMKFLSENSQLDIIIELKGANEKTADAVYDIIEKCGVKERTSILTKNTVMLKYVKREYNLFTFAYPAYNMEEIEENRDFYGFRDDAFVPAELISKRLCKKLQGKGMKMMMASNADFDEIMERIDHGASALLTKEPDKVIELLKEIR